MSCGAIYSAKRHKCGRRAVLWVRLKFPEWKHIDFWKCDCGAELPLTWSQRKRGRHA